MSSALLFHCTSCGNCCRTLRVAVTALDVARLALATGRAASGLVAWLPPQAIDLTGERESFVELSEGRRLMVLAQHESACLLLGPDARCRAYADRPRDCRTFPFDLGPIDPKGSGGRRLELLPLEGCDYTPDGQNDAAELEAEDSLRSRELAAYRAQIARWKRRAFHRRRLGRRAGSAMEFLNWALGLRASERADID